jgi:hypothetical protein
MRLACAWILLEACQGAAPEPGVGPDAASVVDGDAVAPPAPVTLGPSSQLCKLLSNRNSSDPTPNDVQHRSNILGADLGIPVVHDDKLFVMFGDTIGFAGIWGGSESHPDSVGYGTDSALAIASQPNLLCTNLRMLSLPASQSIGPSVNTAVQADFAGVYMSPPSGHAITEYIHNPSGGSFANLPGDFEVPSGAFSYGDSIYIFYTTVVSRGDITMKGSYLARWSSPSSATAPAYQIQYAVDERFDTASPLHGHFINISAQVAGDYVYLFGTGEYRRSAIYVARKRLDQLATPGGFEELGTIATTPGYGETSVRYFPEVQRWMLLAEELTPTSNRIVAAFADRAEGPWTQPMVVHDMGDAAFRTQYCCTSEDSCTGKQMFNCNKTGFYGTYLFPGVTTSGTDFTVAYTMSSFSPYNVALFQTTFHRP